MNIKRSAVVAAALTVVVLLVAYIAWSKGYLAWAEKDDDEDGPAQLTQALKGAGVSLEAGLSASEREGTPISGKFEIEDGKFQLSIYAQKGEKFSEVILNPKTGAIAEVNPITGGEDLTAAKSQAEAMAKAKKSLLAVVEDAEKTHPGSRAVSVYPGIKDGHPGAEVALVQGEAFTTVPETLE